MPLRAPGEKLESEARPAAKKGDGAIYSRKPLFGLNLRRCPWIAHHPDGQSGATSERAGGRRRAAIALPPPWARPPPGKGAGGVRSARRSRVSRPGIAP